MTVLADAFAAARAEGRSLLIGYLPAGYPSISGSIEAITAMVSAGVDVVEVGLPYSDPLMDGPVIEKAADLALQGGTRTVDVLRVVEAVAKTGAATVVMSYWNPIEKYGVDRFAAELASAGGSGVITPDLIPDEAAEWLSATGSHGLDPIFLVAPSSTEARLRSTTAVTSGFVYAASTMGVTGARSAVSSMAPALVERVRAVTDLPIGVGLGVSTGAQAAEVAGYADGVIVGSALVRAVGEGGATAAAKLAEELAAGVRDKALAAG